jgi:hypothetical protein
MFGFLLIWWEHRQGTQLPPESSIHWPGKQEIADFKYFFSAIPIVLHKKGEEGLEPQSDMNTIDKLDSWLNRLNEAGLKLREIPTPGVSPALAAATFRLADAFRGSAQSWRALEEQFTGDVTKKDAERDAITLSLFQLAIGHDPMALYQYNEQTRQKLQVCMTAIDKAQDENELAVADWLRMEKTCLPTFHEFMSDFFEKIEE